MGSFRHEYIEGLEVGPYLEGPSTNPNTVSRPWLNITIKHYQVKTPFWLSATGFTIAKDHHAHQKHYISEFF